MRDDSSAPRMVPMRHAPRLCGEKRLLAGTAQQPIRQHRHAAGACAASGLRPALGLAPPERRLPRAIDVFHRPPSGGRPPHRSREPLVPIGPPAWRLVGADVAPVVPPPHRDVADGPQAQAWARHPAGVAARGSRQAGDPETLLLGARPRRHPVLQRLGRDRWPGLGSRQHTAPPNPTAAARCGVPCGPPDAASPAGAAHCHPPRARAPRPGAVAQWGRLPAPPTPPAAGSANRPL